MAEKDKLKIVEFCDNFFPQIDGVVRVVDNCAKHLNRIGECEVVVPQYHEDYKAWDDKLPYKVLRKRAKIKIVNKFIIPLPRKDKELNKYLLNSNADIFHVHSPFFIGHYALKLAKKKKIPVIATFHSQFKEDVMAQTHSKIITNFAVSYIVKFFNKCDEVWAPSNKAAETLRSYGYKKNVFVMENGTNFIYPHNSDELKNIAIDKFSINQNAKNLLYVGQLRYVKNLKLVLKTINELVKIDPAYHMYFVGEGLDEQSMREFVKKNNLINNVHFLGKINDVALLSGVYAACDLFFFPSTYDTFSIAVRESCTMKTPCLLTKESNAAEPFKDGINGYLANETVEDMKNKIIEIFSNPEQMTKVGIASSNTIPISFEVMSNRTYTRYQEIIEKFNKK